MHRDKYLCLLIHTKYVSLKKTLIEEEDLNTNKVSFQPVFLYYNCLTWAVETGSVMIAGTLYGDIIFI